MDETAVRWKARMCSLKGLSVLILVGLAALWFSSGERILQAIQAPATPTALSIGDLRSGASTARYVSLSGFAYYDVGYEETSDGHVVASYSLLVDLQTGEAVVVRAAEADAAAREPAQADLIGVVHNSPADLEEIVAADASWFIKQGLAVEPSIYLAEDEHPLPAWAALALLAGSIGVGAVSLLPFFFPATVFAPRPIETLSAEPVRPAADGLRASGRFQQLKRLEPALEVGKRHQRFSLSPANLLKLPGGDLLIYIHYILRTKLYGVVTVSKQESDWGIILQRTEPWQIEPGMLLGWKDRRAVRLQRQELARKPEAVYLTVDSASAQSELVQRLRSAGFVVGMGIGP